MSPRRRQLVNDYDRTVTAVSLVFCMSRCKAYAEGARAKRQDALADVYDGFELLLQEYAEDLGAGIVGRVLIDPITF